MAKAAVKTELVEKVVEQVVGINLTLDEDELLTLLVILNHIGGDPVNSARKHTDNIGNAIHEAVTMINKEKFNKINKSIDENQRAIYFKNFE